MKSHAARASKARIGHLAIPTRLRKINFSDLEFGDQLGEGAFGVVYSGRWKSRDMDVAIKRVPGKINITEVKHYMVL